MAISTSMIPNDHDVSMKRGRAKKGNWERKSSKNGSRQNMALLSRF